MGEAFTRHSLHPRVEGALPKTPGAPRRGSSFCTLNHILARESEHSIQIATFMSSA